jgi:hypothetical protein
MEGGPFIASTESPAAGLENLSQASQGSVCVVLDFSEHLRKAGKPLRMLREMIDTL